MTEDTAGAGTDTTEPVETTTTTSTTTTTTTTLPPETTTTTTTLPRREQERQVELVEEGFIIYAGVIPYFVSFYNDDLDAQAVGEPPVFDDVEAQILDIVDTQLAAGIKEAELTERAQELLADPPGVFAPGFSAEQTTELENAAARTNRPPRKSAMPAPMRSRRSPSNSWPRSRSSIRTRTSRSSSSRL